MGTDIVNAFVGFMDIMLVILVGFYCLFAFVIVRQVQLMNTTFRTAWAPVFVFLAALHFFVSLALLAASIMLVF